MDATKEYYKTLNVAKTASQEEIKKSYRSLARKFHPDLNPNNKKAEDKFKEINEAYEVLGDVEKRKTYDAGGFDPQQPSADRPGTYYHYTQSADSSRYRDIFRDNFDFEDLINQQAQQQRAQSFRGEDQIFKMEIGFDTSVLGAEQNITLPTHEKLSMKIPPGVKTGQKLKLSGRGGTGYNGGPPGDLYIEIHVKPSSQYVRKGDDIEVEVPVLFSTALLGGSIRVPTVDGAVEVKLPPGTSSGTKLRIKDKGIRNTPSPGHLYAVIKITLPKEISPELKQAIKNWHESHANLKEEATHE
jgi:DnaJ-class molecular chaperone